MTSHDPAVRERRMLVHTGRLLLLRVGVLVAGMAYALVMPRLMGPHEFGRLAWLLSILTWCLIAGDLGLAQAITQILPQRLRASGEATAPRWLGGYLTVRTGTGLIGGLAFLVVLAWLGAGYSAWITVPMALSLVLTAASEPLFAWQLGRERADRWGSRFFVRRSLYVLLLPTGYYLGRLTGTAMALVVCEAIVLALGAAWCRRDLAHVEPGVQRDLLGPVLTTALLFHGGNLLGATYRFGGETLVRFATQAYAEVGFYSAALGVFAAAESSVQQICAAFTPYLSARAGHEGGHSDRGLAPVVLGLAWLSGAILLVAAGTARPLAPLLFGDAFAGIAPHLLCFAAALVPATLLAAIQALFVLGQDARGHVLTMGLRAGLFVALGVPLAVRLGSLGASLGFLVATFAGVAIGLLRGGMHRRLPLLGLLALWLTAFVVAGAIWLLPARWALSAIIPALAAFALAGAAAGLGGHLRQLRALFRKAGPG